MEAKLQGIEGEDLADRDRKLAVEDEALGVEALERCDHVGEVAGQRLAGTAQELDLVTVADCEAAEAVPLRLVLPAWTARQLGLGAGFHRQQLGHDSVAAGS